MRKIILLSTLLICGYTAIYSQSDSIKFYKKTSVMIPMRDGVKLYTVILEPVAARGPVPVLIERTPYSASVPFADNSTIPLPTFFPHHDMASEGYIFVFQDIRGKYKSEGSMQIHQPLIHLKEKN